MRKGKGKRRSAFSQRGEADLAYLLRIIPSFCDISVFLLFSCLKLIFKRYWIQAVSLTLFLRISWGSCRSMESKNTSKNITVAEGKNFPCVGGLFQVPVSFWCGKYLLVLCGGSSKLVAGIVYVVVPSRSDPEGGIAARGQWGGCRLIFLNQGNWSLVKIQHACGLLKLVVVGRYRGLPSWLWLLPSGKGSLVGTP